MKPWAFRRIADRACVVCSGLCLLCLAYVDFDLFHMAIDVLFIATSLIIALLMLGAYKRTRPVLFVVVGGACPGISILVFFHMIGCSRVTAAADIGAIANTWMLFAVAARFFFALSLLIAVLASRRSLPALPVISGWVAAAVALTALLGARAGEVSLQLQRWYSGYMVPSELLILQLLLLALYVLLKRSTDFDRSLLSSFQHVIVCGIASQLCFAFGRGRLPDSVAHVAILGASLICSTIATRFNAGILETAQSELSAAECVSKTLLHRLVDAQEDERRRLSRELHDDIGQAFTGLAVALGSQDLSDPATKAELQRLARHGLESTRRMARNLRPAILDDGGLIPALRRLMSEIGSVTRIACDFEAFGNDPRLPTQTEVAIFRVVQEGLTNIAKHSRATRMSLSVRTGRKEIAIVLEDNGVGMDMERAKPGLGFTGMSERLSLVGGRLEVESAPGQGTTLFIRVPVSEGAKDRCVS